MRIYKVGVAAADLRGRPLYSGRTKFWNTGEGEGVAD